MHDKNINPILNFMKHGTPRFWMVSSRDQRFYYQLALVTQVFITHTHMIKHTTYNVALALSAK